MDFFTKAAKSATAFRAHRKTIMNEPAAIPRRLRWRSSYVASQLSRGCVFYPSGPARCWVGAGLGGEFGTSVALSALHTGSLPVWPAPSFLLTLARARCLSMSRGEAFGCGPGPIARPAAPGPAHSRTLVCRHGASVGPHTRCVRGAPVSFKGHLADQC